jgi:hypothetical protein
VHGGAGVEDDLGRRRPPVDPASSMEMQSSQFSQDLGRRGGS